MSSQNDMPNDLSDAQLLRIEADGECDLLNAAQAERLDALLSDNAGRVSAERELRRACGRVMVCETPPDLAARVQLAMDSVDTDDAATESRLEAMAPHTRSQSFWQRAAPLAMAAVLAMVASVILLNPPTLSPADALTRAASFVASEHGHCEVDIDHATHKLSVVDVDVLPTSFARIVGQEVALSDLVFSGAENVSFEAGGECHVPGGKSMHLRFTLPNGERASLFVQADQDSLQLDPGVTYKAMSKSPDGPAVFLWDRAGLTYYLVTEREFDCANLRDCIKAPQKVVEIDQPV